jgi:hypothetical protein
MTVIPSVFDAILDQSDLHLPRYAQMIRYDENAFFGINAPTNRDRACRQVWSRLDREMVARNLREAQTMIEDQIYFPFGRKYITLEQIDIRPRMRTKWARVQSLGVKAITNISLDVALNHTTDPATFIAVATTIAEDEIHFFEHDTDLELYPDSITHTGTTVTATFPRARLVKSDMQTNPEDGWPYNDTGVDGPFIQSIDIKRIYTDTTDAGVFVWPLGKKPCPECTEETEPACGYIQSAYNGVISMLPIASSPRCICRGAEKIRVNYLAGQAMDTYAEDSIMHLAHSLMSVAPCAGCDPLRMLWASDQFVPQNMTQERADNMFGVSEGAWRAYAYVKTHRYVRLSSL